MREIEREVARDLRLMKGAIWDKEERRVPIPMKTKREVYERANKRCESCGKPLKITDKDVQFHHTGKTKPSVKSRPTTIQLLCASCHTKYGHEFYTVTKRDLILPPKKETRIRRMRVRRHKSPYWEKKPKSTKRKRA